MFTSSALTVSLYLSVGGWQSLEKPLGALQVGNSALCGVKCSSMGADCGMFHYNKNTKDCTPVKVTQFYLTPLILRSLSDLSNKISCIKPEHEVQERVRTTISTSTESCDLNKMIDVNIDSSIKPCQKGKQF